MPDAAPSSQRSVGSTTESCPLKSCSLLVQVLRADTGTGVPGISVKVDGPTPVSGDTEGSMGIREFTEMRAGKYKSEVSISGASASKFSKFQVGDRQYFSISRGGQQSVIFMIHPPGALHVKVFRKDTNEALKDVVVQFTGPDGIPDKITPATGTIVLDPLPVGRYEARIRLPEYLEGRFHVPSSRIVEIKSGKTERLVFEVGRFLKPIRARLIDTNGKPIPNEPHETPPDDKVVDKGKTDEDGRLVSKDLEHGPYKLRYTGIDMGDWEKIAPDQPKAPEAADPGKWEVPPPPAFPAPRQTIRALLRDERGTPIVGEPYEILSGDHVIETGQTDADGRLQTMELDPGSYQLRYSRIDKGDWEETDAGLPQAPERAEPGKWEVPPPPAFPAPRESIRAILCDERGTPLIGEPYDLLSGDEIIESGQADIDGRLETMELDPGTYQLRYCRIDARDWEAGSNSET